MPDDAAFCPRCGVSYEDMPSLSSGYGKLGATTAPRAKESSVPKPPVQSASRKTASIEQPRSRQTSSDGGFKAFVIIGYLCCLGAIPLLWWIVFADGPKNASDWALGVGLIGTLVLGGMSRHFSGYWQAGCPNCGRWAAARRTAAEFVDRQYRNDDVQRRDEHWSRDGQLLGTTTRNESVLRTIDSHRVYYRCRFCGDQWDEIESRES